MAEAETTSAEIHFMRAFIQNVVFIIAFCLVLTLGALLQVSALHGEKQFNAVLVLGTGMMVGAVAGGVALHFFQRRHVRGAREMSYKNAKSLARRLIAQQSKGKSGSKG